MFRGFVLDLRKRIVFRGFLFVAVKVIPVRTEVTGFSSVNENLMMFLEASMLVHMLVSRGF